MTFKYVFANSPHDNFVALTPPPFLFCVRHWAQMDRETLQLGFANERHQA